MDTKNGITAESGQDSKASFVTVVPQEAEPEAKIRDKTVAAMLTQ